jgi:hypothetical protein
MFKSFHQTPGQIHNTNVNNKFSEIVVRLKYFGMTVTNKNYIDWEIKTRINFGYAS